MLKLVGWFMVFNATFNNISVISWRSVVLVEETGVPGENHRPVASHWQTLSHNVASGTPYHEQNLLKTGDELRCSGRVGSSCSTGACVKAWICQRRKKNNTNTNNKQKGQKTQTYKQTNNTLQNITENNSDWPTRTQQKGGELRCCGGEGRSCSNSGTYHILSWISSMWTIY